MVRVCCREESIVHFSCCDSFIPLSHEEESKYKQHMLFVVLG
jgi:hypothetical protein